MNGKFKKLVQILKSLRSVVVAYSGGVDSTFLLKAAVDTLGRENVLAVTARSETYPAREFRAAKELARHISSRHKVIHTSELWIKGFKENPVNRCYYCKKELFKKIKDIARAEGLKNCIDGTNYDDLKDIRYGRQAAKELGIRSPLVEARITKADIRKYSKQMGLKTWQKPSFACLASRFPHKTLITKEKLSIVERAEEFIRRLGVSQVRVRCHGRMARIEIYPGDIKVLLAPANAQKVAKRFKMLGFRYVTVDLEGYRTGSMNRV